MVHCVRIHGSTAHYSNRYIQTQRLLRERAAGFPLYTRVSQYQRACCAHAINLRKAVLPPNSSHRIRYPSALPLQVTAQIHTLFFKFAHMAVTTAGRHLWARLPAAEPGAECQEVERHLECCGMAFVLFCSLCLEDIAH